MAISPELKAALSNVKYWEEYQSKLLEVNTRINIPFFELKNGDLSSFKFTKCDFQGIRLINVNLDYCEFHECVFSSCMFECNSLVNTKLIGCKIIDSEVNSIVIRNTEILECYIEKTTFTDIELSNSDLKNTNINGGSASNLHGTTVSISYCFFEYVQLTDVKNFNYIVNKLNISKCSFSNLFMNHSELSDCIYTDTIISKTKFNVSNLYKCKIIRPNIANSEFINFNIFNGLLIDVDLNELQINNIGFLGSSLVNCKWPDQKYTISLFGKYRPAANLLCQPVEDIQGVPPKLRAEIRRSQFIDDMVNNNITLTKRFGLWFWAVTSEYGRSIIRLTLLCLSMIFFLSFFYWECNIPSSFVEMQTFWIDNWKIQAKSFFDSIRLVALNFVGIENSSDIVSEQQKVILIISRFVGLIFFGLWIGIAINKFGYPR